MFVIGYPLQALATLLGSLLSLFIILLVIQAVLSWVKPDPRHPLVRGLRLLTEPVLRRVRPYVPTVQGFDLTPIVVVLLILFVQMGLLPIVHRLANILIGHSA